MFTTERTPAVFWVCWCCVGVFACDYEEFEVKSYKQNHDIYLISHWKDVKSQTIPKNENAKTVTGWTDGSNDGHIGWSIKYAWWSVVCAKTARAKFVSVDGLVVWFRLLSHTTETCMKGVTSVPTPELQHVHPTRYCSRLNYNGDKKKQNTRKNFLKPAKKWPNALSHVNSFTFSTPIMTNVYLIRSTQVSSSPFTPTSQSRSHLCIQWTTTMQ